MKWAVLGASGFIGSRFIEKMHLTGEASVRPIVRNFSSLARLARFELDWRVTDLGDVSRLTEALEGCDALLHSIVGDEPVILGSIAPVYEAAQRAGVRRIVYLSSSSAHGLNPPVDTTEDTPLSDTQPFGYNNAKVRAERLFQRVREKGTVELVGLRPSIVFGPRSRWCSDLAKEILAGTAYLLQEGRGICNTIYVDNLIRAIVLAAQASNVDGHYILVRDREKVTWREFYEPILKACGVEIDAIHHVEVPAFNHSKKSPFDRLRGSPLVQTVKPLFPKSAIRVGKAALKALPVPPVTSPWQRDEKPMPRVTREVAALQQCLWQMPCTKAEKLLGYQPEISFAEGMQRSIGWLKFAGYPLQGGEHASA